MRRYGAQHPIVVHSATPEVVQKYVVVGHCCESGDLFTCAPGEPEALQERLLSKAAIGTALPCLMLLFVTAANFIHETNN